MSDIWATDTTSVIRHFVAERLRLADDEVGVEDDLRSLPGFDSMHALQIVLDVEQYYDIEVEDHVVFGTHTVREFAAGIDEVIIHSGSDVAQ